MCILCSAKNPNDLLAGLDQHLDPTSVPVSAPYTLDQIADQLTSGYWGGDEYKFALDGSRTLTYNVSGLSTAERAIAVAALEAWTEVSGIAFVATTSISSADIVFDNNDPDGAYAYSETSGTTITKSYVNIPSDWAPLNLNGYMLQTYMHEIGHALGLGHAGNYNGDATFGVDNLYDNDSWLATVMSYFDQIDNTLVPGSFAWISSLMPADIIAIQNLYGFSGATNDGNSTYGKNSNIGGYLQTLLNQWTGTIPATSNVYVGQPIAFTIYDSTGTDTLDFSNFAQNQEISLVELAYSNIGGLVDNVTIARGVVIENAISGGGNDTLIGNDVDNLLRGNNGNDRLTGSFGNDRLEGGNGDDSLYGGSGDDRLYGSFGNDRMEGGDGNDTYYVNSTADAVVEAAGAGTDTVQTGLTNVTLATNVENLVLTSTASSTGTGNALSNTITGSSAANTLIGLDGFDFIYGGGGNDSLSGGNDIDNLYGGDGNDSSDGGAGDDWLYGALGNDTLLGGTGDDRLLGEDGNDRLDGGEGGDVLTGGIGNDLVIGRDGDDYLYGGDGADRLFGFAGSDRYEGGLGVDQFVMNIRDEQDVFVDFTSGVDKVLIGRAGLGIAAGTTLAAMWQTGGALPTTFSGSAPVLYYDSTSRVLFLDTDGGSSSNATGLFGLQEGGTLTLSDLLIA
jgi:serralysin